MKARLAAVLSTALIAFLQSANAADQHAFNFVAAYNLARERRLEADKKLLANMDMAADWLMYFKMEYGHLPEPGPEQEFASMQLNKLLKPNPYSSTGIQARTEFKPCPLRFLMDYGLNDEKRQQWQKKAPTDWQAEPGTITFIMSHNSYVVVWGAGADRLPILDDKHKQVFLSWHEFK